MQTFRAVFEVKDGQGYCAERLVYDLDGPTFFDAYSRASRKLKQLPEPKTFGGSWRIVRIEEY